MKCEFSQFSGTVSSKVGTKDLSFNVSSVCVSSCTHVWKKIIEENLAIVFLVYSNSEDAIISNYYPIVQGHLPSYSFIVYSQLCFVFSVCSYLTS